jgi:hypothetical protein
VFSGCLDSDALKVCASWAIYFCGKMRFFGKTLSTFNLKSLAAYALLFRK